MNILNDSGASVRMRVHPGLDREWSLRHLGGTSLISPALKGEAGEAVLKPVFAENLDSVPTGSGS